MDCFSIYKDPEKYPRVMLPQTLDDPPLFLLGFTLGECSAGMGVGLAFMVMNQGSMLTFLSVPVGLCTLFALKKYREIILPGIVIHVLWSLGVNVTHKNSPISGWFYSFKRVKRYVP